MKKRCESSHVKKDNCKQDKELVGFNTSYENLEGSFNTLREGKRTESGNCNWNTSRKIRKMSLCALLKTSWKATEKVKPLLEKPHVALGLGYMLPGFQPYPASK